MGYHSTDGSASRDLVILIHGWEGSASSTYLLSAAAHLWNSGFDVFRLNLRDHGRTQHLNEGLFHSCRLDEVLGAVKAIVRDFLHRRCFLGGFSLGGNFALRVAARAPSAGIPLQQVVAICPVLYPPNAMDAIEAGPRVYHDYLLKKWQRSLKAKLGAFPHLTGLARAPEFKSLNEMNAYFIERFTDFPSLRAYLEAYAITGDALSTLSVPSTIIFSLDDPMIPAADLQHLAPSTCLSIETTSLGGHCGFIMNHRLESWADHRMAQLFAQSSL
jgi:predicted alpha/beta-fold hydrolase